MSLIYIYGMIISQLDGFRMGDKLYDKRH